MPYRAGSCDLSHPFSPRFRVWGGAAALLLALVFLAPVSAVAQGRASLQVAARVVSNAPSQAALTLAGTAAREATPRPTRTALASVVARDLPPVGSRKARVVRIDFLRN